MVFICIPLQGKIRVDQVRKFALRPFSRLSDDDDDRERFVKRATSATGSNDSTVLLEFEGIGKRFGLWLEPHDSILQDASTIRIHQGDEVVEEPIGGKAYVGKRVVVLEKKGKKEKYNMATMVRSSEPVDEDVFAHFYIEPTK